MYTPYMNSLFTKHIFKIGLYIGLGLYGIYSLLHFQLITAINTLVK